MRERRRTKKSGLGLSRKAPPLPPLRVWTLKSFSILFPTWSRRRLVHAQHPTPTPAPPQRDSDRERAGIRSRERASERASRSAHGQRRRGAIVPYTFREDKIDGTVAPTIGRINKWGKRRASRVSRLWARVSRYERIHCARKCRVAYHTIALPSPSI